MSLLFGLIMCACVLPMTAILFSILYPKNIKKCKIILGVVNRDEYKEGETAEYVEKIFKKRRKQASYVLITVVILSGVLLLINKFVLETTLWMILLFGALLAIHIPFILGNKEMKDFKRRLGIVSEKKIVFSDLKNAGTVRTFNLTKILIPNILSLLTVVAAVLIDTSVIKVESDISGNFMATIMLSTFFLAGIILSITAYLIDNFKNDVISEDSAINANYNRALKKNMFDYMTLCIWLNFIFMLICLIIIVFFYADILSIVLCVFYMIGVIIGILLLISKNRKIEALYSKEFSCVSDDDDNWIFGMIYHNKNYNRVLVKKRIGVGSTINSAHPVGKILYGFIILCTISPLVAVAYIGMAESTPLKIQLNDENIVCRHTTDYYTIDYNDIKSIEYGSERNDMRFIRVAGYGMPTIEKGNFTVNGEHGCAVFLNPETENYIKIVTEEKTYYIGESTKEGTEQTYNDIKSHLKQ